MPKPYRKSLLSILLPRLSAPAPRVVPTTDAPRFQAISIHRGSKVCGIAKQLGERRFLAKSAPVLPLAGCSMQGQCQCRYVKHRDRRTDARRLMDVGVCAMVFDGREKRFSKGRRSKD